MDTVPNPYGVSNPVQCRASTGATPFPCPSIRFKPCGKQNFDIRWSITFNNLNRKLPYSWVARLDWPRAAQGSVKSICLGLHFRALGLYLNLVQLNLYTVIPILCNTAICNPSVLVEISSDDEMPVRGEADCYETFSLGAINVTGTKFDVEVAACAMYLDKARHRPIVDRLRVHLPAHPRLC